MPSLTQNKQVGVVPFLDDDSVFDWDQSKCIYFMHIEGHSILIRDVEQGHSSISIEHIKKLTLFTSYGAVCDVNLALISVQRGGIYCCLMLKISTKEYVINI